MPNWCFNTVTIQDHSAETIDSIKNLLNRPFSKDAENWNMESQKMEFKTYNYSNPVFSFWNIIAPTDLETYQLQKDPNENPDILFSGDNWYNWNVRNWGTKWDVAVWDNDEYPDTELLEHVSNDQDQWIVYRMNTAWSPPVPALEKLSALYPSAVITLEYEEETGWGGELEFVNGKITAESTYDNKCRDCDEINTLDYCDDGCGEICSSCNWMGEADLECVAECQTHKIYLDDQHIPEYRKEALENATRSI